MEIYWIILLIALAANLDNLSVGIAYGIQKIKISHTANIIIALISFLCSWLSAEAGEAISLLSPEAASIIGAVILCGVGLWVLLQPILATHKAHQPIINLQLFSTYKIYVGPTEILRNPQIADIDHSRNIGHWESVLLGIALSINALAGGFDAGAIGISSLVIASLIGIVSFITILAGCYAGREYATNYFGKYTTIISGILLILIGCHQLIA